MSQLAQSNNTESSSAPVASQHPTEWQRRVLWRAITLVSLLVSFVVIGLFFWGLGTVTAFLQPVLIPVAAAGILAYLLDPVVDFIRRIWPMSRTLAVVIVFCVFLGGIALLLVSVIPEIWRQSATLGSRLPELAQKAQVNVMRLIERIQTDAGHQVWMAEAEKLLRDNWSSWSQALWGFVQSSIGGVLGWTGFLLSLVLVPVYLFFFLKNSESISATWSNYLPLRASAFRDELVGALTEINGYLINFFRGQLIVSIIDGILTGLALYFIVKLPYAALIGFLVAILGLIPYLGIVLSLIPALIVAAAEFGDWQHPLTVLVIFLVVQNLDGILLAPKIVGDSVGLHPMTVIVSVIVWSLVFKGVLGALLAVPLTATIKVLFRRYIWYPRTNTPMPQSQ